MIWLVGSKGMLGTEVSAALRRGGLPHFGTDLEVDITDAVALARRVEQPDAADLRWIVNCAAYTAVDKAEIEPESARRINGQGPRNLAELAHRRGASIVHISTDYVFDGLKEGSYTEQDQTNPLSVYGETKLEGEQAVVQATDRYTVLRTSWLYGRAGANFVATMLRLFSERDEVRVVADQWGSPTSAVDLAAVIAEILGASGFVGGVYHFSNEGRTTWYEFACEIYSLARAVGRLSRRVAILPITTSEYPTRAVRPRNSCLDKTKIKRALGIDIRPWQEALRDYLSSEVAK